MMLGEELEATYARLQEHLEARDIPLSSPAPATAAAAPSRKGWLLGLLMVALLPFVWLGVLHYTLGGLIDEVRAPKASEGERGPKQKYLEALRTDLNELRQQVERLGNERGQARKGVNPDRRRLGSARRPTNQGEPQPDAPAPSEAKADAVEDAPAKP
ncbi:MAG: hypothetical protein AAF799_23625 [Myxococcota bacterium]